MKLRKLKYILCKFGHHKVDGTRVYKEVVKKPSYKGRKPVKKVKWYRVCQRCGKKVPLTSLMAEQNTNYKECLK